jgi:hypothetical protein
VAAHCDRTFLSLWGMANPFGSDPAKELCDYIVVCDPDIIIFSVKDVGLAADADRTGEQRWLRRAVDKSVAQVYEVILGGRVHARMLQSLSGVAYVFLALDRGEDRKHRVAELAARCKIARGQFNEASTVVGIASERANDGARGLSFDLCLLEQDDWTEADENEVTWLREELGLFKAPDISSMRVDEYPKPIAKE